MKKKIKRYVGFWAEDSKSLLPRASDFIDEELSKKCRKKIINYLRLASHNGFNFTKGFSRCRICKTITPGSHEITDGEYIWPSGYIHYIMKHNVIPPPRFLKKMLRRNLK